jgi:hypothetical protein
MFENFFGKFNRKPEDEERMEANLNQAREILNEDERTMEGLVAQAKNILERASEHSERGEREEAAAEYKVAREQFDEFDDDLIEGEVEKTEKMLEELNERLLDESSSFYTNVDKGSVSELFYRTVMEEVPDSGISINETVRMPKTGETLDKCVAVETVPYKTDRTFLFELGENPVIQVLKFPEFSRDLGKQLEEQGLLPPGTTDKGLARYYRFNYQGCLEIAGRYEDKENIWKENAAYWKGLMDKLGAEPISNDEAKELMRTVIREVYRKKLGI